MSIDSMPSSAPTPRESPFTPEQQELAIEIWDSTANADHYDTRLSKALTDRRVVDDPRVRAAIRFLYEREKPKRRA